MTLSRPFAVALAVVLTACIGREAAPNTPGVPPVAAAPIPAMDAGAPAPALPPLGTDSLTVALSARPVTYNLAQPDAVMRLAPALEEISGLTWTPAGHLLAIEDETGTLYTLDPASGRILDERRFAGRGDYEDVEWVNGTVWVLRSDGRLYAVPATGGSTETFETPLRRRCDAEGLVHDAPRRRLLIACKENPGRGLGNVRAVYSFSLATHTLDETPVFTMDRDVLDDGRTPFKPSALAIHPETSEIYVVSSVRKAIAIVGMDGRIVTVMPLPETLYPQPEGLAFAPDGTLYISSEAGHTSSGTLLRFRPRR